MTQQLGYYHHPTVNGDRIVFVCEDDLWQISDSTHQAIRLTANLGEISHPVFSPDGTQLAFVGEEEGNREVYVMPAQGGMPQRLTFLGSAVMVVGWTPDSQSIIFTSNAKQPFRRIFMLYTISPADGAPQQLPWGAAHNIAYGANGGIVLGRNTTDIARWKRYRGGTAGVLWIDPVGSGEFYCLSQRLGIQGNFASPMWIGERIYFISDHEGIGNLYSCNPDGTDLQAQTQHREYYVRFAKTDGRRIVYQMGADLFWFEPETQTHQQVEIQFYSPQVQRQRKFVDPGKFLQGYSLHPEGHSTVITARGQSFSFGNWEGAVTLVGQPQGIRYRLTHWLNDGQRWITITDRNGKEGLEIYTADSNVPVKEFPDLDLGRVISLAISPKQDQVALTNHRQELIWVDLVTGESRICDHSDHDRIRGISWSPDGEWIAYSCSENQSTTSIKLVQVSSATAYCLTPPRFRDFSPSFDPAGRFLYFLSTRDFNPVYDNLYFDLNFPKGTRPYLISLQKDTLSPFIPQPKPLTKGKGDKNGKKSDDQASENSIDDPTDSATEDNSEDTPSEPITIDFEGIEQRIVRFPVPEGIYLKIQAIKDKVLFSSRPISSSLRDDAEDDEFPKAILEVYNFEEQKRDKVATGISGFKVAADHETILYRSKRQLRVGTVDTLKSSKSKPKEEDSEPGRKSGWLDLSRVKVSILPTLEWQQMFNEIWRLQREQFWTEDMSGVDWDKVRIRYQPLLERVSTRSEFSDLIWEMHGELGTSHAYESGGDYRHPPNYRLGYLGADWSYDPAQDAYRIERIVQGDAWNEKQSSPLSQIGLDIQPGDLLLSIGGQRLSQQLAPETQLVNQAGTEISLTLAREAVDQPRTITVKTLRRETPLRYRGWVETNYNRVHEATQGRVGYVHIPDMSAEGYAEFHRYYLAEVNKPGLIIDVRYNGGGNVSQLLLEKLARQRIGYDISRWGQPEPYPDAAPFGPMVALTNEQAGSDGDIFSHCFKLMNLGTLIGKRTWGGVIGIWPRHGLVDGTWVTQPEFSFWFKDVGWRVENYGTDPDIEVEITPRDWAEGRDPQMEKALELILAEIDKQQPKVPDFGSRPHLGLP